MARSDVFLGRQEEMCSWEGRGMARRAAGRDMCSWAGSGSREIARGPAEEEGGRNGAGVASGGGLRSWIVRGRVRGASGATLAGVGVGHGRGVVRYCWSCMRVMIATLSRRM